MTDDRGFTLPEILVCMPLCLMLMTALVAAYGVISQNYIKTASQWAYIEEVRTITDIVRQRVRRADNLSISNSHTLWVKYEGLTQGNNDRLQFYISPGNNKGVFLLNGQPVSSDDSRRYINIRDIVFEQPLPHKVIMRLTLENKATGRISTVESSMYSRFIWMKERYGDVGDGE
ncbi:hypothetical protein D081_1720 [Anaerovibrio sp. JC8]|uniref:PulJ/GspJ family protein n=1 Tax=Anaerovibrio sp. JC8 TaxID=1240085 RepID=UPI000A09B804|nr:hypothetical protein [Anaerovibrio sp. JC8]ORT99570.1 hypothetical protein D081_1720 [Anaerovibrio sp. JC8]